MLLIFIFILLFLTFVLDYYKSNKLKRKVVLHSMPFYHGIYGVLCVVIPITVLCLINFLFFENLLDYLVPIEDNFLKNKVTQYNKGIELSFSNEVIQLATKKQEIANFINFIFVLSVFLIGIVIAIVSYLQISANFKSREKVEKLVKYILFFIASISIFTTLGILFSLIFGSISFFKLVPFSDFLFGVQWSPQSAIRQDSMDILGVFGIVPVLAGTFLVTFIAMVICLPIGIFSAIYFSEYMQKKYKKTIKSIIEILAGIPTVVYGFFGVVFLSPLIKGWGSVFGFDLPSEMAIVAGVIMGVMLIPFVSSLSDDALAAVPNSLREASYGLGATTSETVRNVILPAAKHGIISACLLSISRAIGETMIVVMAAGMMAKMTLNPFEAVTTVTVQIVTLLVGDQEFDSAKTLSAFALALVLLVITLCFNFISFFYLKKRK